VRRLAAVLVCLVVMLGASAEPAAAFNPLKAVCSVASFTSGLLGKACDVVAGGGRVLSAGKQILSGRVGSAVKTLLGQAGGAVGSGTKAALTLAAIGAWVLGGARFALHEMGRVLSETTTPRLDTSWFSATYWRVAGIAALLTMPFLFAAVVQALAHSDLSLLLRAALGYLPLAVLLVSVAAPMTMLLLSASDELSGLVTSATSHPGSTALALGGSLIAGLSGIAHSPFLIFFLGLLTVVGAITLWMELLMREAAVYVVVLMLPLAFAALVWPARRIWAIRAVELLVALILSKFAIVAVLSLGGAAMDQITHSITAPIVGLVLVGMAAFAPWALVRLVPLAELGASAVEGLRPQGRLFAARAEAPLAVGLAGDEWANATTTEMRRAADRAATPPGPSSPSDDRASARVGSPEGDPADLDPSSTEAPKADGGTIEVPAGDLATPAAEGSTTLPRDVRLPGLPEMWQAGDGEWRPLIRGLEEGWPPDVHPRAADGQTEAGPPVEGSLEDGQEGLPTPETTWGAGLDPATRPDLDRPGGSGLGPPGPFDLDPPDRSDRGAPDPPDRGAPDPPPAA
jgi:hypothetical protein